MVPPTKITENLNLYCQVVPPTKLIYLKVYNLCMKISRITVATLKSDEVANRIEDLQL